MNNELIQFKELNFIWLLSLIVFLVILKFIRSNREAEWFYPALDQRPVGQKLKSGFFKEDKNYHLYRILPRPKNFSGWLYMFLTTFSIGFFIGLVMLDATMKGYLVGTILGLVFFFSHMLRIMFYNKIK